MLYTAYSVLNYAGLALVLALILSQIFLQYQSYQVAVAELRALTATITTVDGTPDVQMVLTEQIYAKVREGASLMVDQINTLILLIFCSLGARFLTRHTIVGEAFEEDALRVMDVLVYASVGLTLGAAWLTHFFFYDGFFAGALAALDANRAVIADGGWSMLQRFNDLYLDLTERRGLTGFMIALTTDRGGLLLALGALSWLQDRRGATVSQHSAG
jgi:hypothetical protein